MKLNKISYGILIISLFIIGISHAANTVKKPGAPLFNDLSIHSYPVSTNVPLAQRYFDQGMAIFSDSFSYSPEAVRSFRESIRLDPMCAMCYWGLALASTSKAYMAHENKNQAVGYAAIKKAHELVNPNHPKEKAFIDALLKRYEMPSSACPSVQHIEDTFVQDNAECSSAEQMLNDKPLQHYADAMRKMVEKYPNDNFAKFLYVIALADLNQWQFYLPDGKPKPNTTIILNTLNALLKSDPNSLAGHHIVIHVTEQSADLRSAIASAKILMKAPLGADHLLHMPSHIYFLLGDYHTLWASAMMEGQWQLAITSANALIQMISSDELKKDSSLQLYLPTPLLTEVRFGKWGDILKQVKPAETSQYAIGFWHYARGVAYAKLNKLVDSEKELAELKHIAEQGPVMSNLGMMGHEQLEIAVQVLSAVLADAKKNPVETIEHLQKAVNLQDKMEFHTPPSWYFSIREELGYALLKTKQEKAAIVAFKESLKERPKNGWALYGLAKALQKDHEKKEAQQVTQEYKKAWQYADIPQPISLF